MVGSDDEGDEYIVGFSVETGSIVDIVFAYDSDVDYRKGATKDDIDKLKRVTNVYIIADTDNLLGGLEAKNAPVDCGEDVWRLLYENKRKVV